MAHKRCLIMDGDILAYQFALAHQTDVCLDPDDQGDNWYSFGHFNQASVELEGSIHRYMDELDADSYVLALTDSGNTFRQDIFPQYKSNRKAKVKPVLLHALKQWMIDELDAYFRPRLEGDDIMGILSTSKHIIKAKEKVIVSLDKDMKTIPGLYCRDLEAGIVEISEEEADYWHMYQTLCGDTTDGYPGCPKIGPVKAEKMLIDTRGYEEMWPLVVEAFDKQGLSEEVALVQAQVARILRATDYDFKRKKVKLWQPPQV